MDAITSPTALHPALGHTKDQNLTAAAKSVNQQHTQQQKQQETGRHETGSSCEHAVEYKNNSTPSPHHPARSPSSPDNQTASAAASATAASSDTVATKSPPPLSIPPADHVEPSEIPSTAASLNPAVNAAVSSFSLDSVPRQTLMKALASVARNNKPEALSLDSMLYSTRAPVPPRRSSVDESGPSSAQQQQQLSEALSNLAQRSLTPNTALPALQSPCFYHARFDDAVDIDRVLEEITGDEAMSHSRLVQTATSVREVSKQLQRRPIKRAVRNVMIVTKARDNELVYLTKELAMWLLRTPRYGDSVGVNVYVDAKLKNSKRFGATSIVDENPRFESMLRYWTPDLCWSRPEKFDLVLTLGGDGTVLFTSWLFQRIVPPVLSFSLGSLGFLTNFEFDKYKQSLGRIMGDDGMRVNLRMRFTCTIWRNSGSGQDVVEGEQFEVLNELLIDRGPSPYVSNLELYGDDELLTVVQADGCIFSTPTGSTAYSLSAGGSLVHPDIPAILLTPICPHTLSFRPMVLSDTMLLRVAVPRNSRATAYCAFDGKGRVELKHGDYVTISASQYPFPTVMSTSTEWFNSVSRTLQWNTRAAMQKGFESKDGAQDGGGSSANDIEPEWDIDTDSACYASEDGSISASPVRRQMSMLGM